MSLSKQKRYEICGLCWASLDGKSFVSMQEMTEVRTLEWQAVAARVIEGNELTPKCRICRDHFEDVCIEGSATKPLLKKYNRSIIPTLNLVQRGSKVPKPLEKLRLGRQQQASGSETSSSTRPKPIVSKQQLAAAIQNAQAQQKMPVSIPAPCLNILMQKHIKNLTIDRCLSKLSSLSEISVERKVIHDPDLFAPVNTPVSPINDSMPEHVVNVSVSPINSSSSTICLFVAFDQVAAADDRCISTFTERFPNVQHLSLRTVNTEEEIRSFSLIRLQEMRSLQSLSLIDCHLADFLRDVTIVNLTKFENISTDYASRPYLNHAEFNELKSFLNRHTKLTELKLVLQNENSMDERRAHLEPENVLSDVDFQVHAIETICLAISNLNNLEKMEVSGLNLLKEDEVRALAKCIKAHAKPGFELQLMELRKLELVGKVMKKKLQRNS